MRAYICIYTHTFVHICTSMHTRARTHTYPKRIHLGQRKQVNMCMYAIDPMQSSSSLAYIQQALAKLFSLKRNLFLNVWTHFSLPLTTNFWQKNSPLQHYIALELFSHKPTKIMLRALPIAWTTQSRVLVDRQTDARERRPDFSYYAGLAALKLVRAPWPDADADSATERANVSKSDDVVRNVRAKPEVTLPKPPTQFHLFQAPPDHRGVVCMHGGNKPWDYYRVSFPWVEGVGLRVEMTVLFVLFAMVMSGTYF